MPCLPQTRQCGEHEVDAEFDAGLAIIAIVAAGLLMAVGRGVMFVTIVALAMMALSLYTLFVVSRSLRRQVRKARRSS